MSNDALQQAVQFRSIMKQPGIATVMEIGGSIFLIRRLGIAFTALCIRAVRCLARLFKTVKR